VRPKLIQCAALLAVWLLIAAVAQACPNCTNSLAGGDEASQQLIRGYFWSILFMMSMPFAILFGLGGYMYLEVRRARAKQSANDGDASES
jgi:uncharacterized paraquat-inducible protein A